MPEMTPEEAKKIRDTWDLSHKGGKSALLQMLGVYVGVCDFDGLTIEDVVVVNQKAKETRASMRAAVEAAERAT